MRDDSKEPVYCGNLQLFCVTDLAILVGSVGCHEDNKVWIPKSQILASDIPYDEDEDDVILSIGYLQLPRWIAEQKGLY